MGKTEKNKIENHATKVPKTKRRKYGINEKLYKRAALEPAYLELNNMYYTCLIN